AFSRAIRADKRYDLTAMQRKIDIANQPSPAAIDAGIFEFDQFFPRRSGGEGGFPAHLLAAFTACLFFPDVRVIRRFGIFPERFQLKRNHGTDLALCLTPYLMQNRSEFLPETAGGFLERSLRRHLVARSRV